MNALATTFQDLTQALTPKPRLLPSFRELVGHDTAEEVRIALRERQNRLLKAGHMESLSASYSASVALGFELWTETDNV